MSYSAGIELDHELDQLNAKIDLLAEHLGVEFEYEWGEVSGIKKKGTNEQ